MMISMNAPWMTVYKEISKIFECDREVKILYNTEEQEVKIYVDNSVKATALDILLKHEYVFGNVTLKVNVYPANDIENLYEPTKKVIEKMKAEDDPAKLYSTAFAGNDVLRDVKKLPEMIFGGWVYVLFDIHPAQFFTDDMSRWNGYKTMLYEDIARDIFEPRSGVSLCTMVER